MKHKVSVYEKSLQGRVVAILRKIDVSQAVPLAKALVDGGVTSLEVTMDTKGGLGAISDIQNALGGAVTVGAGTVLDTETGRAAMLAGAEFLVAPNLNPDLIRLGNRYGRLVVPGCMTPTEVEQACEAGADIIKIFPAGTLGPGYIKSIKGPLDHVTVMATGGIHVDNAAEFCRQGADLLGVGGNLVDNALIAAGKFQEITAYAEQLVNAAKEGTQ